MYTKINKKAILVNNIKEMKYKLLRGVFSFVYQKCCGTVYYASNNVYHAASIRDPITELWPLAAADKNFYMYESA